MIILDTNWASELILKCDGKYFDILPSSINLKSFLSIFNISCIYPGLIAVFMWFYMHHINMILQFYFEDRVCKNLTPRTRTDYA